LKLETSTIQRNQLINWTIGALLILAAVLIVDNLISQLTDVNRGIKNLFVSIVWLSPILLISLIALAFILGCKDEKRLCRIGLIIILFSMLCRLAWIFTFDSYQVNDFGSYINCSAEAVATGKPSSTEFFADLFWKRSAFYTYPVLLLFGKSLPAIKLVNVVLTTLTSFVFFRLGIALLGTRLAAIGLLFFIWQPDLWYSMTLASPDIPGMFWLAVFFWICAALQHRAIGLDVSRWTWVQLASVSILLGASIFFLDFTRSYHFAAILALGGYVALESMNVFLTKPRSGGDRVQLMGKMGLPGVSALKRFQAVAVLAILWLALPLGTYFALNRAFWVVWKVPPGFSRSDMICDITTMEVLGTSTFEEVKDWSALQCPKVNSDERNAYALRKLLHDLTHDPREFFRYLQRKNRDLGLADDYVEWSTYRQPEPSDATFTQVKHVNSKHVPEQRRAIAVGHAIVLALVLWRMFLYPHLPFRRQEWIVILFSGCFYALILLLLESQPRYDIFLTFLLSLMAAQSLDDICRRMFRKTADADTSPAASRYQLYAGGALLIAILVGVYWGGSLAIRDSFFTLRDQSGFTRVPTGQLPAELKFSSLVSPVFVKNNHKELTLGYAPGLMVEASSIMAAQRTFTVREEAAHHLRFFISVSVTTNEPYESKIDWTDTDLECLVAVNGKIVVREKLNRINRGNLYVSLSPRDGIVFTPRTTLQFIIRNPSRIESVGADRAPVAALEYIDLQ
jgi:hypothetical protein